MSCDGGFQERFKHVLVPTRGYGKCPVRTGSQRYAKQACNTHDCVGDEECIAKQDLLIAIDSSGSLTEQGFGAMKEFASRLMLKYHTQYFGAEAMKIGVILFGNGAVMPDGVSISPA